MVNLVFCGPGGSGKHKLIDEIRRRCKHRLKNHRDILHVARKVLDRNNIKSRQDFECNDRKYTRIIREIIEEQCAEEDLYTSGEFITDNCVINELVIARRCIGGNIVEDIVEGNALSERSLSRYRSSLVVLVGPCHYVHDDMMGFKLKPEDWDARKKAYTCLFHQYKIPYINVTTTELTERSNILSEALGGKLSLETSQLEFYNPKLKPEDQEVQTTFSFYLPHPKREQSICIPTIKITEHKYELDWTEFKNGETNRFIARHGHERLSCLEFNINVRSSIAQKVMLNGITINGDVYSFIGCSSNGLKRRKCYMWKGSSDDVKSILQGNGDFEQIKTVSKRMARVGLLFSGVSLTRVTVGTDDIVSAEDIMFNGQNFSDGCGGIGTALAKTVFEQICDSGHDENYLPSVYQIRFQGYKGVLALDRALPSTKILVRPSMKKFRTDQHSSIGVCGYSRAYTFGHLNKQFILLLSGLGVPDDVFEQKQKDHLEMIDNMRTNSEIAMRMLQAHNEFHLALLIARVGCIELLPEYNKTVVMRCIRRIQEKMISKLTKLDLLIPESRNLFGICDTSDTLDYGECFLRLTVSGKPMTVRGQVVVCKNPSYLLGDIRVLTAVDDTDKAGLSELNHLVDCIVFPSRGKRPHSAEIAGSDLDGDQYFVSWDTAIIPRKTRPPYDYPGAVVKEQGNITHQSMLSYFSKQNETQKMTGRVDKYFNKWADIKNVTCTECERLGQLFSRIVDANKTGEEVDIPLGLDPREVNESDGDRYVWQRMKSNAIEFEEKLTKKIIDERDKQDEISTEFVMEIVSKKHSNITEFEKFKFFWYHARRFNQSEEDTVEVIVENVAHHINFASFGIAERREVIEVGVPVKYVTNALNTSYILSENDLKHFQMDSPLNNWCRYAALEVESFDWSHLYKTLTTNDRALVVLGLPDDVILELQFLERLEKGIEQNVKSGTISSVFYSKQFDYKYRYILGPEYILDLTEDTLQLYRDGKKNLTFVWLKATDRKMTKRRWNKRVSDEVVNSLSVDLQRFDKGILTMSRRHPLINKMPFVQIEIYAQNLDGTVPYWDTFDVNDILPVPQEVEKETETEEDINRDFESLFPKLSFEEDISDENIFNEELQNTAQEGNPFLFKSILDKWHNRYSFPVDSARMFIKLLENIAVMIVPVVLPENIQILLTELS